MRGFQQRAQISLAHQHGHHDGVEKQQMKRRFCEHCESVEDHGRQPQLPRRFTFRPRAQPQHNRDAAERNVHSFQFRQPAFIDRGDLRHHHDRGDERLLRDQPTLRCDDDHDCKREHAQDARKARRPRVFSEELHRSRHAPLHEWRLSQKRLSAHVRHGPASAFHHRHSGHDATPFLALQFRGAEAGQENRAPQRKHDQQCVDPVHARINPPLMSERPASRYLPSPARRCFASSASGSDWSFSFDSISSRIFFILSSLPCIR